MELCFTIRQIVFLIVFRILCSLNTCFIVLKAIPPIFMQILADKTLHQYLYITIVIIVRINKQRKVQLQLSLFILDIVMPLSVSPSFTWTVSINQHKNTITFDLRLFHSVYDRLLEKIPNPIHTNKFYRLVDKMF